MKATTVEYDRRSVKSGCKQTHLRAETWTANVMDFAPRAGRAWGFASLSIHANGRRGDTTEIAVRSYADQGEEPCVSVSIGGSAAGSVFLSPEQARTLAVSLAEATGLKAVVRYRTPFMD